MGIQLFDGEKEFCASGGTKYVASRETLWTFDCDYPYEAKVATNGQSAEVWKHRAGYYARMR